MDTKDFKDRNTLRSYFLKNKIPTEANFADLIKSSLNQIEDGICKPAGDPLSIVATGDAASPQKLINFYGNLSDSDPSWTMQMNPRSDQDNPATAKMGFSISDGQGNSRVFVDKGTGSVGIGTNAPIPVARLNIQGGALAIAQTPTALTKADAAIHVAGSAGGFDRLLQMSPILASKPGLNLLSSKNASGVDQWWAWGTTVDNKWRVHPGTDLSGEDGLTITSAGVGIGTAHPATPLHIVTKIGPEAPGYKNPMCGGQHIEFAATGMWGLSDSYGTLYTWETDSLFIGLKNEGSNRKDSIIAFGDDPDDSLRFLSVPSGAAQPVEHLRITSAGSLKSPKWRITQVFNSRQGPFPLTGQFISGGGTLLIICSGSGWATTGGANIGMVILLDGSSIGTARCYTNEAASHKAFSCNPLVQGNVAAGTHSIGLSALTNTSADANDWFNLTVLELPF